MKKPKKPTLKKMKALADKTFSEYIRRRDSVNDMATCITCGKTAHYKEMQAGHYVGRSYLATRFNDKNCFPQCIGCNCFQKGRLDEYALFLTRKFGPRILEYLNEEKQKQVKYSIFAYQQMIGEWQRQLKSME